eukprot:1159278-Pelagomonas_calceolata.AAC.7
MHAPARERAWRIGQTREVVIYRLITSGTIEEKVREERGREKVVPQMWLGRGRFCEQVAGILERYIVRDCSSLHVVRLWHSKWKREDIRV